MIVQGVSKEERAANPQARGTILGNAKIIQRGGGQQRRPAAPPAGSPAASAPEGDGADSEVPF